MKFIILSLMFASLAFGQTTNFGKPPGTPGKLEDAYLKDEDQQYYKNQAFTGQNESQRTDSLVKEINKLHGEMADMKSEIEKLRNDVETLKKK